MIFNLHSYHDLSVSFIHTRNQRRDIMKLRNVLIATAASVLFVTFTSADPVPYPNVGSGGSTKVDGKSVNINGSSSSTSTDSGSTKGMVSSKNTGKSTYASSSSNVKAEGKNVTRLNTPTQ